MQRPGLLLLAVAGIALLSCVQAQGFHRRHPREMHQEPHRRRLLTLTDYGDDDSRAYSPYEPYGREHEHSGSEYVGSKREVINLEMVADPDAEPSSPLAQALRNTTDTEIKFGLVCRQKKSAYYAATASTSSAKSASSGYYDDEDTGPLIDSTPSPLLEIGKGQADLVKFDVPRPVDIGHQRALEVGTLNGSFTTRFTYRSGAPCSSLLEHNTVVEFGRIPVYAMITKTKLPLDVATLRPLLPLRPTPPPATPTTPLLPDVIPPIIIPPTDDSGNTNNVKKAAQSKNGKSSGKVVAKRHSLDATFDALSEEDKPRAASAAARVSIASEGYGYGEELYDEMMAGVTLVARGPVRLRSGSGPYAQTYRGTIEVTLLWTNGLITLPSFIADALALTNGGSTNSLFTTTVNQMLTSTIINGFADASFTPYVGNSAASTAVYDGSSASATGGNVNVTQANNTATATANNATLSQGNTNSDNSVSVVNDVAGALEMYLRLLKTMCKQHKGIPVSRPANLRLDVTPSNGDSGYDGYGRGSDDSDAGLDGGAGSRDATTAGSSKKSSSAFIKH